MEGKVSWLGRLSLLGTVVVAIVTVLSYLEKKVTPVFNVSVLPQTLEKTPGSSEIQSNVLNKTNTIPVENDLIRDIVKPNLNSTSETENIPKQESYELNTLETQKQPYASISGHWVYPSGKGHGIISEDGNNVTIYMNFNANRAPKPHYELKLQRNGNLLSGTWVCLIDGFRGCNVSNEIILKIATSGNSISIVSSEDPKKHGFSRGAIILQK